MLRQYDRLVRGLRSGDGVAGVLGDVTVVHPVTGRGLPSPASSTHRRAAAADGAERRKQEKYLARSTAAGFGFRALAFETYGAPGVDCLAFLKEAAERVAASPLRARDVPVFQADSTDAAVNGCDDPLRVHGPTGRHASLLFFRWCTVLLSRSLVCLLWRTVYLVPAQLH